MCPSQQVVSLRASQATKFAEVQRVSLSATQATNYVEMEAVSLLATQAMTLGPISWVASSMTALVGVGHLDDVLTICQKVGMSSDSSPGCNRIPVPLPLLHHHLLLSASFLLFYL